MKQITTIVIFFLAVIAGNSQVKLKTIVPSQPIVSGESFQVQYVIEDADRTMTVKPPVFSNFRVVAGPAIHMGSVLTEQGTKPLRNAVYTLEADRPGRFIIRGATIQVKGQLLHSNDAYVDVISVEEAARNYNKEKGISSDYFLRPGEDPYEKIRQNLFVKVQVDKKNCYAGEAVQATFKLYSRLESKSDIVKNPGFYGFTVYDVVNLTDKQSATEKLNGQVFDVHTIRKVQLYPLQAGDFTVDPMQVRNKVEFSRSAVSKKTEQEIVEGVLGGNAEASPSEGTDIFETDISTEPVTIHVKPVPEKSRPAGFDGATGKFRIEASLVKNNLAKNEEGFLDITVIGKGNFIQLSAPVVQWPAGVEGFEPVVQDNFDKSTAPLSGKRTFRFSFVAASAGLYQLAPVRFSFYNTDSNQYHTIQTTALELRVSAADKKIAVPEEHHSSIAEKSERAARIAGGIIVLLVLLILGYWIAKKKEPAPVSTALQKPLLPAYAEMLEPAQVLVNDETNRFYSTLHGIIWQFAALHFGLTGSGLNKKMLVEKMNEALLKPELAEQLSGVLEECETGMFTNARVQGDRQHMLDKAKEVFLTIRPEAKYSGDS